MENLQEREVNLEQIKDILKTCAEYVSNIDDNFKISSVDYEKKVEEYREYKRNIAVPTLLKLCSDKYTTEENTKRVLEVIEAAEKHYYPSDEISEEGFMYHFNWEK